MPEMQVKQLCEVTYTRLKKASMELERFLNQVTLAGLVAQSGDPEEYEEYYRTFLSDLRHLLVYCENAYEKLGVCLRRARFDEAFAEEVLYRVYQTCVNHFYYPKGEVYDEESRCSYEGRDAISFKKPVSPELRQLILNLAEVFEALRDELHYYESDYLTKKQQQTSRS